MAEDIVHAENNTFINVCSNMIQIVSKGSGKHLTAILTPEQARAIAARLTNAPKQTVVSENPVVHVPINQHVAMTNQLATLQKQLQAAENKLKESERDASKAFTKMLKTIEDLRKENTRLQERLNIDPGSSDSDIS